MHDDTEDERTPADAWTMAADVLGLASQLVDGIQAGVAARGFGDVRPAHGFAFVRISQGHVTVGELAQHLGITKQAASQLAAYLASCGYLASEPDPRDARARLLRLTDRGRDCTVAAERAAADVVECWRGRLTAEQFAQLCEILAALRVPGRLRPAW